MLCMYVCMFLWCM